MGPERKAPENHELLNPCSAEDSRFNGAGAESSGKRLDCASGLLEPTRASMGPERKAPENLGVRQSEVSRVQASMGPERKSSGKQMPGEKLRR